MRLGKDLHVMLETPRDVVNLWRRSADAKRGQRERKSSENMQQRAPCPCQNRLWAFVVIDLCVKDLNKTLFIFLKNFISSVGCSVNAPPVRIITTLSQSPFPFANGSLVSGLPREQTLQIFLVFLENNIHQEDWKSARHKKKNQHVNNSSVQESPGMR